MKQRRASQSPLRIHSVQLGVVKELDNDVVTLHEVHGPSKTKHSQVMSVDVVHVLGSEAQPDSPVKANL